MKVCSRSSRCSNNYSETVRESYGFESELSDFTHVAEELAKENRQREIRKATLLRRQTTSATDIFQHVITNQKEAHELDEPDDTLQDVGDLDEAPAEDAPSLRARVFTLLQDPTSSSCALVQSSLDGVGAGLRGMGWDGMAQVGWDGMGNEGVGWGGVGLGGVGLGGVEWDGAVCQSGCS